MRRLGDEKRLSKWYQAEAIRGYEPFVGECPQKDSALSTRSVRGILRGAV